MNHHIVQLQTTHDVSASDHTNETTINNIDQENDLKSAQVDPAKDRITGQGIHSDGADKGMVMVIEQTNVRRAFTQFHG